MAQKTVLVDGVGEVILARRKGMRGFRLSIGASGLPRLSLPYYVPQALAINFILSKKQWLIDHKPNNNNYISGVRVGKSHRLLLIDAPAFKSRVKDQELIVSVPMGNLNKFTEKIDTAINRALKKEAEALLPQRLDQLSKQHGLSFKEVKIKKLKSRWGSCSSNKSINLSYYLIQLPWDLIDYVLCHELAHTLHMNHQKPFWDLMRSLQPNLKQLRKEIRQYHPGIILK